MKKFLNKLIAIISNNRWIIIFVLAIPFFNEVYPPMTFIYDYLIDGLKIVSFVTMAFILYSKKRKPSVLFLSLVIIEIWWMVSTIINYPFDSTTYYAVYHKQIMDSFNAFCMALIVECFIDNPKDLLSGLLLNFELALYPHMIVSFVKPYGDNYQLLGYYSVVILWTLPALCVSLLNIFINKRYFRSLALFVAIFAITIRTWCATIVVAFIGFFGPVILGVLLMKIDRFKDFRLPLSVFVVFAVLLNLFVLFIYTDGSFPLIDVFIEKFLRRSTSFSERGVIWQEAMRMIKEKPLVGHGFRPTIYAVNSTGDQFIHAHNQLLQRLVATGIIGLITFAIFHIFTIAKVDRSENSIERLVLMGGIFGICITYITEGYKKFFRFYLIFFLAYHVDELIKAKYNNSDYLLK